ncbi:MAG: sugar-binding domain-containing protein [Kiritimatiellia bacterium]
MNMRKTKTILALALLPQAAFAVFLDGAWEIAYSPYDRESREYPVFAGVTVEQAVPGYWEDMVGAFRAAGMKDEFRINPSYKVQRPPFRGYALDTTLPDLRGTFFYRRRLTLERVADAVLAFEGVRNNLQVWINGAYVATHRGYSAPFELPVPADVLRTGANEIVLAVCNGPVLGTCDYVSGLTSRGLFASTGGVNGHVEFLFRDEQPPKVHVTTAADCKSFTVHAAGAAHYVIRDGERVLAAGDLRDRVTLPADGYELWTPERPKLYGLEVSAGGRVTRQAFGIRRLTAQGEKLRLNGQPVYLRGVTEHCYFPQTVHLPRDLAYYRMITAKRKELGFNFVRFHTFVPPVEYLQATDELGMLVHLESPNFTSEAEYAEIIAFARPHPSVVIYCTGNETRIDRQAERYLADIAELVHARTDALFSPMSAMRGVEYLLMAGLDPVVATPFEHNAERMARLAPFCDLFTSYANGMVSYQSLDAGSSAELDRRGDAFLGRPRLSHEICIDSSYADFSLERLYPADSPILKTGLFSGVREHLRARGLLDRADVYFRHSCEWMRRIRKHCCEKLRAADRIAGYDFLGDINTHWHTFGYSVGLMDEFYRLKPGETVRNVNRYNGAAVVLSDLGNDFNVPAGAAKRVAFSVSNYARDAADARLTVRLVEAAGGRCVWTRTAACGPVPCGALSPLAAFDVAIPATARAVKYLLVASVAELAENEWELYAFPAAAGAVPARNGLRVVTDLAKDDLLAAMARGERVLLLGAGPFKSLGTTFRIGMAGRTIGNYATVINPHPVFADFPHEGYCGWQFRRLLEGGRAVQLEAGVPFDPVVDVASSVKFPIRQAMLFEYRVGNGRMLVCSFNFADGDPAAAVLRAALVGYASGDRFEPPLALTPAQLAAVIDAPLLSGETDTNRANNVNDPASLVRAHELAQP